MSLRPVESFSHEAIARHLSNALNKLSRFDRPLFTHDVNERSICFRLGLYLQDEFPDFDVDCEYNRNHEDPKYAKRLHSPKLIELRDKNEKREEPRKEGTDFLFVYPDIIVHRRGTPDNLLVIETKKTTSKITHDFDLMKLSVYRKELEYRFATFLLFRTEAKDGEPLIAAPDWR